MQDRPTFDELLAAIERFLENDVMAHSEGAQRFHARIAVNSLRIVRRELMAEDEHLAFEWDGLNRLLGDVERPADRAGLRAAILQRNADLCDRIRTGDADSGPFREAVHQHVRQTVRDKLLVTNPDWLRPHRPA